MTALTKYARLEATGLWRADATSQRREVIVSIGEATLVITDLRSNTALTHWSLAAIERQGSSLPAIFNPDGDPDERLEIAEDESEMIEAIETLRRAVAGARPKPGRLRWFSMTVSAAAVAALAVFWLPGALTDHALQVLPPVKKAQIGDALLQRITRVGGPPCTAPGTGRALQRLATRTGAERIAILPGGVSETLFLPGGTILLNRTLVEDFEDPFVAAGYIIAELARMEGDTALRALLDEAGLRGTASLLTTGQLPEDILDAFAEKSLATPRPAPTDDVLLARFATAELPASPYAYARDISGETTRSLITADPLSGVSIGPIMTDADWVRLQSICGA